MKTTSVKKKTKPKPKAAELRVSGETNDGGEIKYLYINGKTDKESYLKFNIGYLKGEYWNLVSEYHQSKVFDALMKIDGADVPDSIYATFEKNIKLRYAFISHIIVRKKRNNMSMTFSISLPTEKMLVNPYLVYDHMRKRFSIPHYPDLAPRFFQVEIKHTTSGKMHHKLQGSLTRINQLLDEAEKLLVRRIKKL